MTHEPPLPQPEVGPAHLLLDADDTLWRSNDVFEDVYEQFVALLQEFGHDTADILETFRSNEQRRVAELGTGHAVFLGTLEATCIELGGHELARRLAPHTHEYLLTFEALGSHLYDDTILALERLKNAAPLALVTRGNPNEQHAKIAMSGLGVFFHAIYVVPDKTPDVYSRIVADLGWPPNITWMIGNSLRHDIHPALTAGLGAVHIDRAPGWILEHAERPKPHQPMLDGRDALASRRPLRRPHLGDHRHYGLIRPADTGLTRTAAPRCLHHSVRRLPPDWQQQTAHPRTPYPPRDPAAGDSTLNGRPADTRGEPTTRTASGRCSLL